MKVPKTTTNLGAGSGFGIGNLIGIVFVLIGILLVLGLMNYNLPLNIKNFNVVLQYGAALGSILGGLSMLFKKKEIASNIK